nr:immunoglobulin mu heavy chain [Bos taurus]
MNPLWTLLFVLSAPRGVLSQVQLQESGPSLVKPSQTLSLTCTVSGFSLSDSAAGWVRQAPGKALSWVCCMNNNRISRYRLALKSRLSITKDNPKSRVSVSVSSVAAEDPAVYCSAKAFSLHIALLWYNYCGAYGSAGGHHLNTVGQGLLVTVSSEGESHPRVF